MEGEINGASGSHVAVLCGWCVSSVKVWLRSSSSKNTVDLSAPVSIPAELGNPHPAAARWEPHRQWAPSWAPLQTRAITSVTILRLWCPPRHLHIPEHPYRSSVCGIDRPKRGINMADQKNKDVVPKSGVPGKWLSCAVRAVRLARISASITSRGSRVDITNGKWCGPALSGGTLRLIFLRCGISTYSCRHRCPTLPASPA